MQVLDREKKGWIGEFTSIFVNSDDDWWGAQMINAST